MSRISVTHIGHAQQGWLRGLDFYKQELEILKPRLTEIAGKNTAKNTGIQVEHFENQICLQKDHIDGLRHKINALTSGMAEQAQENDGAGYVDQQFSTEYDGLEGQYAMVEKLVNELRHEFNKFSSTTM